jgi:hypothetical protein
MATAVWALYASDRLMDASAPNTEQLEERHRFHLQHRAAFLAGIVAASLLLAFTLPAIPTDAMRLYLVLGGFVFGYFVIIHVVRGAHRLPKEIAVGICFAAAVYIPTVAGKPELRFPLLASALLFAALCVLNCLYIYAWEHPLGDEQQPHPLTALAVKHLGGLTMFVALASGLLAGIEHRPFRLVYIAVTLSALALLLLHRSRGNLHALTLRSAADFALLTPVFMAGWR